MSYKPRHQSRKHKPKHMAAEKTADRYITISTEEYVFLVKSVTLLETIFNDDTYTHEAIQAARETMRNMIEEVTHEKHS